MCRYASTKRGDREMNKTLLKRARCMLSQAKLGKEFCDEAVSTTYYLINRSPHTALNFKCLREVWYSSPIDYSNLKIFGCDAYIHVNEGKLEPRARTCTFFGYGLGVKGYRVWCGKTRRIITSSDVKFDESSIFVCPLDIVVTNNIGTTVVTNNIGTTHDACEEVESTMDEEATTVENDMY